MFDRRTTILGIPVDRITRLEFRMFLNRACASGRAHRIFTVNPEIILAALESPRYGSTIRTADCCTIDGFGVSLALRCAGNQAAERITGSDVLEDILSSAAEEGRPIAFLLRADGLTSPTLLRTTLRERWPNLHAAVAAVDPRRSIDRTLTAAIRDHAPQFLVVNFGHPFQEEWIATNVDVFPTVRVAVGIGGAIDYLTNAVPKPPVPLSRAGLEWAWRLARQPRRWRRIVRATLVFPYQVAIGVLWGPHGLPLPSRCRRLLHRSV